MTFGILGPLDVRDTADRPLALRRRKARTLLALLLCHRDRNVSADLLTDWLWDAQPPASALANLHSYVSDLRRMLTATSTAGGLHTTHDGYLLEVRDGQLDADRFAEMATAGERDLRNGDVPAAVEHLGRAAGLWRGEVLADHTLPPVVRAQLAELTQRRLTVLTDHAQARLMLGRYDEVAAELTTLTARFPRHEPLWRQLMLAHAHAGRRDEADLAYHRLVAAANEDGAEPTAESTALSDRIRRADVPEMRVRQRSGHGSSGHGSSGNGGTARWVSPRHLPAPPDRFVGRHVELAALDRAAGNAQLITIVGGPGTGKTGLALTWAHRIADRYPDGQLHVELHGHTTHSPSDPRELLGRMFRAIGATVPVPGPLPEAAAALRTALAGRRMLIVLDAAETEAQVRPLLPGTASCLTVVTSRNRLDGLVAREGATRLRLDELSPAEAQRLLLAMREPSGRTDDVAPIALRCGYLPLALRIVAASGHEDDPLTASDGERSVRAAFHASWSRLGELEQYLFRVLGLMPERPFTAAEAAAAVAVDRTQVAEALGRLDRVSLLRRLGSDIYRLSPMAHRFAARMTTPAPALSRYRDWPTRVSESLLRTAMLDDSTVAFA